MFRLYPEPPSVPAGLVEPPLSLEPSVPPLMSTPPLTPKLSLSRAIRSIRETEFDSTIQSRPSEAIANRHERTKFHIKAYEEKQKQENERSFQARLHNGQITPREKTIYKEHKGRHTSDLDICNDLKQMISISIHQKSIYMQVYCKNPKKQNICEALQLRIQQEDLANSKWRCGKLFMSGPKAIYLSEGSLTINRRIPPIGHNTTKSLDGIISRNGNTEYLTYMKTQTGTGGSQDLSCADGVKFLTQAVAYAINNPANSIRNQEHVECRTGNKVVCPTTIRFILIVDGTYYTRAKIAMLRGKIPQAVTTRVSCMHSYHVGPFVRMS